jgi:peptidoglycan/LPS O-acetylase OafA/YrhL
MAAIIEIFEKRGGNHMDLGRISRYRTEIMGLACMYIVAFHNIFDWPAAFRPLKYLLSAGNIGVEVFLIMSGIGLYFAYYRNDETKEFYKRRFVRLLVPYVLLGLPYYLWWHLVGGNHFLLSFTNLAFPIDGLKTTWFIFAIATFYLVFPLIFKLQNRECRIAGNVLNRTAVTYICCTVWFVLLLVLQKTAPTFYSNSEIWLTRFIIFMLGCWFGKYVKEGARIPTALVWGLICSFLIYIFIFVQDVRVSTFWSRMIYIPLSFGVVFLFVFLSSLFERIRMGKVFRFFGERSLEIYMSQVMILNIYLHYFGRKKIDRWDLVSYIIVIAAAVLLATLIHPLVKMISTIILASRNKQGREGDAAQ